MLTKVCITCDLGKPLNEFYVNKNYKYGVQCECKLCCRLRAKAYRSSHQREVKAYGISYRTAHREEAKLKAAQWAKENPGRAHQNMMASIEARRTQRAKSKLKAIKHQGCICPGCGVNFSSCLDKALLMCFHKSHIHSKKCALRVENEFFWSCLDCNIGKQKDYCGHWAAPGIFKTICQK